MKSTSILAIAFLATFPQISEAANLSCMKKDGNVCYRIQGTARSRIDASAAFQRALNSIGKKMEGKSVVYIVQGYRTPAEQQRLVDRHCGGRSSCAGYASARTSRHVISLAADPMLNGDQVRAVCHAENQARVEFLGPRSAAAVYGYDRKTNLTWAHIDDSTNSNYTPQNCPRNAGLTGNEKPNDSGAPRSPEVAEVRPEDRPGGSQQGGACYYAILGCSKTSAGASGMSSALGSGLQVVHTDDVSGFSKGWYCVTSGPGTQAAAASTVKSFQKKASGYVKKGC